MTDSINNLSLECNFKEANGAEVVNIKEVLEKETIAKEKFH